jgi:uncharacterized membrane protein YgdD (TMEM256/DUF423 family)
MKHLRKSNALKWTALFGALAVGLGAFGAHGLADLLAAHDRVETWKTAAFYHLVHTVVLLLLATRREWAPLAWSFFASGIFIFSGSLYLLCLTDMGWLGAVTPLGGLLLIAGWISLAFKASPEGSND